MEATVTISIQEYDRLREFEKTVKKKAPLIVVGSDFNPVKIYLSTENEIIKKLVDINEWILNEEKKERDICSNYRTEIFSFTNRNPKFNHEFSLTNHIK